MTGDIRKDAEITPFVPFAIRTDPEDFPPTKDFFVEEKLSWVPRINDTIK